MSEAALSAALAALETHLKGQRLKMTEQRRQMLRAAFEQPGHFTADELHERLRDDGQNVSLATVYRSLLVLEASGILEGHDFDDGKRRYERLLARAHHDHMVCMDCRAVVEFRNDAIERLQKKVAKEHHFAIREHHLTLFVACDELAQKGRCTRREKPVAARKR